MGKRKGLPWVMVSVEVEDHPKVKALVHRLGQPFAAMYLIRIWSHFGRWHEDGWVTDTDDAVRAIEAAARWEGKPGVLVTALAEIGLLDRKKRRISIHGWNEWSGKYALEKRADRERKSRNGDRCIANKPVPTDIRRNADASSPSPSPSQCPSALEGEAHHQGSFPTSPKPIPTPFWLDVDWQDGIRRSLSADGRDALDEAISRGMTTVTRAHKSQLSPDWVAAEADARRRIEERFVSVAGRSRS